VNGSDGNDLSFDGLRLHGFGVGFVVAGAAVEGFSASLGGVSFQLAFNRKLEAYARK